jgi:hypothetical protein
MALESLAPDQRAVVQLVLQQGRSYGDLAALLGISEDAVRQRARAGLANLGADHPLSVSDQGAVADWLLGQQDGDAQQATGALLGRSAPAREWAEAVAGELQAVARHGLPAIPAGVAEPEPVAAPPEPVPAEPEPARRRPRGRRGAAPAPPGDRRRSSKLGGAVLLSLLAALLVAFVVWIVNRSDDGSERAASATSTAKATATPKQHTLAELPLTAVKGSRAEGLVQINAADDGQVGFTLVARNVPANTARDAYAVWLTGTGKPALRLGFAQRVGKDGTLATSGPEAKTDAAAFTRGLTTYAQMVVSKETSDSTTKPSRIVLRASLAQLRSAGAGG